MVRLLVVSGVALVGLMGLAPAQDAAHDAPTMCVYPNQVERLGNDVNPQSRYFQASRGRVYRLDTATDCFEPSVRGFQFKPYVSTSDKMCPNDQLEVTLAVAGVPRTCVARLSEVITDPGEIRSSGLGLTGR